MKRFTPILLVIAALVIAGFSLFGSEGLPKLRALEKSLNAQKDTNIELYQNVRSVKREVHGLQTDDRILEKAARNELGMARPGEQVFVFSEKGK